MTFYRALPRNNNHINTVSYVETFERVYTYRTLRVLKYTCLYVYASCARRVNIILQP